MKVTKGKVKKMIFFILGLILLYILLQTVYSLYYFQAGRNLSKTTYARKTTLGNRENPVFKLFIAGDSVGAGVGATSFESSVAGRIGNHFATDHFVKFENVSVSGNKVHDVLNDEIPSEKQNLIVLIVSSNNLFRFTSLTDFQKEVPEMFAKFSPLTDKLILIGPGRIEDSAAIPLVIKPFYKIQGSKYAMILKNSAAKYPNIFYVNPLEHRPEKSKYGNTFASDNFHPNDSGHRYWFDMVSVGF